MLLNTCAHPLFGHLFIVTDSCGDKTENKMWQSYATIGKAMTTINKKHKHKNTFVYLYSDVIQDSDQIETNLNYIVEDKDSHKYTHTQTQKHVKHKHTDTHILTLKWSRTVTKLSPI